MKSLYSIDFTLFSKTEELIQRLQKDKYWLYSDPAVSTSLKEDSVKQRVKIEHNGCCNVLKMILYETDKDYTKKGLNPRTELRSPLLLPSSMTVEVFIIAKLDTGIASVVTQIMGRITKTGSARPLVQLEVRDEKFCVRYAKVDGSLISKPICPVPKGMNAYCIEYKVRDFLKVSLNDKVVFEFDTRIDLGDTNIQFGLYRNKDIKRSQEISFKKIDIRQQ